MRLAGRRLRRADYDEEQGGHAPTRPHGYTQQEGSQEARGLSDCGKAHGRVHKSSEERARVGPWLRRRFRGRVRVAALHRTPRHGSRASWSGIQYAWSFCDGFAVRACMRHEREWRRGSSSHLRHSLRDTWETHDEPSSRAPGSISVAELYPHGLEPQPDALIGVGPRAD